MGRAAARRLWASELTAKLDVILNVALGSQQGKIPKMPHGEPEDYRAAIADDSQEDNPRSTGGEVSGRPNYREPHWRAPTDDAEQ